MAQPTTMETTTKTPKGTFIKDRKVHLSPGYKISLSEDGKIGTVKKDNGSSTSGTFKCASGDCKTCKITVAGGSVYCSGTGCECMLIVSVPANSGSLSTSGDADGKVTWKILEIPKTKVSSTSNQ